jgi:hypothetical protein
MVLVVVIVLCLLSTVVVVVIEVLDQLFKVPVSNQAVEDVPVHVSDISVKPPTTTADVKLKFA